MTRNGDSTICGFCCGLLTRLLGLAAGVAFAVFGIMALKNESNDDVRQICAGSTMWSALLVQVILAISGAYQTLTGGKKEKKKKDEDGDAVASLVAVVILVGVASWAIHETRTSCVKEHFGDSPVRTLSRGWALLVFGVFVIAVLGACAACWCPSWIERCSRWIERRQSPAPVPRLDPRDTTDPEERDLEADLGAAALEPGDSDTAYRQSPESATREGE